MKLTIDLTGKGGLAPNFYKSGDAFGNNFNLRYEGKENQMVGGWYNPFKRPGYLCSVNASRDDISLDTGSINTIITSALYDMLNDDIYVAERGEEVYRGDGLSDIEFVSVLDLGVDNTIHDLEMYMINGVQKIFYTYDKNGTAEVGYADTGGAFANANSDWLTTDVTNNFSNTLINNIFMRVADNGFAYIFMDNQVHKIDGTTSGGATGTATANVITFPPYFQITDAIDTNGRIYMPIRQDTSPPTIGITLANAQVGVYIWDRLSTVVNMQNYIAIPGIREIRKIYVSPKGTIRVITINSEANVEIRELQGSVFNVIETLGDDIYPNYHDSLSVYGLNTSWLGNDGNIYCHGRVSENDKESFYKIGIITSSLGPGIMFMANAGSRADKLSFYISDTAVGANYRLYKWSPYTKIDGSGLAIIGNVYTLVKFLPPMSTVNYINIYCRPAGSGSGTIATIKPYFNQSTTAWASKAVTLDEAGTGLKRIEVGKPFVNTVQLEIEFSTSVNLSGNTDFSPSFAIIDYSVTKTKA